MKNPTRFAIVCVAVVLMIVMLVLQYLPFWTIGEATVSIDSLVWFPTHDNEEALLEQFSATLGYEVQMLDFVWPIVFQTVFACFGVVMSLWRFSNPATSLLPVVCGGAGVLAYLTTPVLRFGNNWVLHLIISILILACGLTSLIMGFIDKYKKKA